MSKKRNHSKNGGPRPTPAPASKPTAAAPDASASVDATADDVAAAPAVAPVAQASAPAATPAVQSQPAAPAPVQIRAVDDMSDIRGVLIQVSGAKLLLPNATIAEVLSFADPDPVEGDVPDWLLGRMRWRGWQVPLIAFGTLAGAGQERAGLGTKVVVLKSLAQQARTPYFAMLTQGFPRLVTVSRDGLLLEGSDDGEPLPRAVQARVRLNEDVALLPDLEAVEGLVAEALAQAA